jgi:tRNA(fMet)-specific endonuclease VapC
VSRFLLDSGIAGDFMNRRNGVYERARDEGRRGNVVGVGVPILAELFYGAENSADPERTLQRLRINIPSWRIWPFTNEAAAEFGQIRALLRRIGRPMQVVDIMIAAIALTLGNCTVVTTDSDLAAVPGLRTENWAAPAM